MTNRFLTLLHFARKFRFHLNRDEPQSFGGGMVFFSKRAELQKDLLVLVGLGFDADEVLSRLSRGAKFPHRTILILTGGSHPMNLPAELGLNTIKIVP
jgi:hypothetical protein